MDNTIGPLGTIGSGQGGNSLMSQQQMQAIIQSLQQKNNPDTATQAATGTPQQMFSPIGAAANVLAGGLGPLIHALLKQNGADDAGGPDEDPNAVAGGPDSPTDTSAGS